MRIGLLNPTVLIRRPIAELAGALKARGHQVTVLTPSDQRADWVPAHFEKSDIEYIRLPSREIRRLLWSWPTGGALRRLWQAMPQFDVLQIWAPYYLIAVAALVFSRLHSSRPKVILTFDTFPGFSFTFKSIIDPLMRIYHRLIGSWLFRLADVRTVYSRQLLPYARRAWLGSDFQILKTGIHLSPPSFKERTSHQLQILFVGILNDRKGISDLITSLEIIRGDGLEATLTLIGDGPQRQEYEARAKQFGLDPWIHFVGRTNDVQKYFRLADVFVLPSYGEGLPGVVMEAMSYGVPVVATNIPCLPDLIPNDMIGLLVPPGQPVKLAQAIRRYADNEVFRQEVARQARVFIEGFDWQRIIPDYEALYAAASKHGS